MILIEMHTNAQRETDRDIETEEERDIDTERDR